MTRVSLERLVYLSESPRSSIRQTNEVEVEVAKKGKTGRKGSKPYPYPKDTDKPSTPDKMFEESKEVGRDPNDEGQSDDSYSNR
jgi:hypothetical protein